MDIARYTSYFHDGEILDIKHINNNIEMFLKSAEVDATIIKDIFLSVDNKKLGIGKSLDCFARARNDSHVKTRPFFYYRFDKIKLETSLIESAVTANSP